MSAHQTWTALRKRLGRPDTKTELEEWFMPLSDKVGKVAWRRWAEALDATYVGAKGEEGVAWDFPLIPRMRRALALAEAQFHGDPMNQRLARVVADLRSYRDTGYSSNSSEKPEPKKIRLAAKGRAALARKRRD